MNLRNGREGRSIDCRCAGNVQISILEMAFPSLKGHDNKLDDETNKRVDPANLFSIQIPIKKPQFSSLKHVASTGNSPRTYPSISRNFNPRRFGIRALCVFTDSTAEQTHDQDNKNNSAEYLLHHMIIIDQQS